MIEPSEPHEEIVCPGKHQVRAEVDIFVPVARKFTLNFHGELSGEEYTVTLEVLHEHGQSGSTPWLPLKLTMESADNVNLIDQCFQVLKAGYIRAKGELVIDRRAECCVHLMDVHWFEAVEVTGAG